MDDGYRFWLEKGERIRQSERGKCALGFVCVYVCVCICACLGVSFLFWFFSFAEEGTRGGKGERSDPIEELNRALSMISSSCTIQYIGWIHPFGPWKMEGHQKKKWMRDDDNNDNTNTQR